MGLSPGMSGGGGLFMTQLAGSWMGRFGDKFVSPYNRDPSSPERTPNTWTLGRKAPKVEVLDSLSSLCSNIIIANVGCFLCATFCPESFICRQYEIGAISPPILSDEGTEAQRGNLPKVT